MQFDNKLKGNVTEIISATLFESHGYRVIPLGVEKVVREIVSLDQERYSKLDLPVTLRSMPDFLVSEIDMSFAWLVEVKYRKEFSLFKKDEALKKKLTAQAEKWGGSFGSCYFLATKKESTHTPVVTAAWSK